MTDTTIKRKDYEKLAYVNHNKTKAIGLIVVILIYAFFFLSPYIFHEKPQRTYTKIGEYVSFGEMQGKVLGWDYCPEQQMSQVSVNFSSGINKEDELEVSAKINYDNSRTPAKNCECEIVYSESDYVVVNIYDIPSNFYCCALTVQRKSSNVEEDTQPTTEPDDKSSLQEVTVNENQSQQSMRVYTCSDAVNLVSTIPKCDDVVYRLERIYYGIDNDNSIIADNKSQIDELNKSNRDYHLKIEDLQKSLEYQTIEEQDKTNSTINDLLKKVENNNSTIANLQTDIQKKTDEISEYNAIRDKIVSEYQKG